MAGFIQPSLPWAWNVPTTGPRKSESAAIEIAGVIGSWTCKHVEALALERAADPKHRARREDDVRQRSVGRDDHRATDGDDVRRRRVVTPGARMQHTREAAGRVVPDDRARVDAVPAEGLGLELGVLDDGAPEGPRVRDDDAHLHGRTVTGSGSFSFTSGIVISLKGDRA